MSVTFMTNEDKTAIDERIAEQQARIDNCPSYIAFAKFKVCHDVLTTDMVGTATNWTANGNAFTHTAGSADPLHIALGELAVAGDEWLITFDSPNITDDVLYLSFGTEAKSQTYNGDSSIAVALRVKENGDDLLLTPVNHFNGTLSNFQIRKITEDGEEQYEFLTNSITTMDRHIGKTNFWNVILGSETTMPVSCNSSRTIAIGNNTLYKLRTGNRNIGVGTFAMSQMESGESNVAIGADSMFAVKSATYCIGIGKGALNMGARLNSNIAIGYGAIVGTPASTAEHNIAVGQAAGSACVGDRNIFIGYNAAYTIKDGIANTYIGDQCVGVNGKNQNTVIGARAEAGGDANRSIAIGYTAKTTKANQCVIGGAYIEEFVFGNKKLIFNADGTVTWETV